MHGSASPCDGKRGKHPAVRFSIAATTDPSVIIDLFGEDLFNVAVDVGPHVWWFWTRTPRVSGRPVVH